ncbi:MAG: gfo/Idh/MocA family oxidoreductase [Bacteroidetes bacterium]|nr:MAG: gfo/Idh/MocA family oxidoreductase [Bacteroidota bacterium]
MNRRNFVQTLSAGSAGLVLANPLFAFGGMPAKKIVMAVSGTNSRGLFLAKMFARLPDVEVAYICDVDEAVLLKTASEVEAITGKRPKLIRDYRKLVEIKEIDAVAIAMPDHWHAPAALMAAAAGKHVYVEKPCGHNPAEGEMLVQAAAKYGVLIQMGNQRRSFPNLKEGIQAMHEGIIGNVYFAKGWYANNRKSIGKGQLVTVPAGLDFELWQGPAPRMPFRSNLVHYNWHWFWHWGTGEALNNGTHEIDVMRWGLDVKHPVKVTSAGGRYAFQDDWETPDTQVITLEFPNGKAMTWEGRSCNNLPIEGSGRGVIFYGTTGSMIYPGGDEFSFYDMDNKLIKAWKSSEVVDAANPISPFERLDVGHLENFVAAIRGESGLNSPIAEGYASTLLPMLGNIAQRSGKTLICDPATGRPNDADALKLWSRSYQPGWEMKL